MFPMTNAVYKYNDKIAGPNSEGGQKVLEQVVFWAFAILPVYAVSIFADVVLFNVVEFWTGEPMLVTDTFTKSEYQVTVLEDGTVKVEEVGSAPEYRLNEQEWLYL